MTELTPQPSKEQVKLIKLRLIAGVIVSIAGALLLAGAFISPDQWVMVIKAVFGGMFTGS